MLCSGESNEKQAVKSNEKVQQNSAYMHMVHGLWKQRVISSVFMLMALMKQWVNSCSCRKPKMIEDD